MQVQCNVYFSYLESLRKRNGRFSHQLLADGMEVLVLNLSVQAEAGEKGGGSGTRASGISFSSKGQVEGVGIYCVGPVVELSWRPCSGRPARLCCPVVLSRLLRLETNEAGDRARAEEGASQARRREARGYRVGRQGISC